MDNAGAVIGPLAASLLLASGVPIREVFLWAIVPTVICLALTLALREPPAVPAAPVRFDWRMGDFPPVFRRYLAVVALFTLGNSSNMFLLLRARELGVADATVPLLWMTVSGVAALFSTPLSALSDRFGRTQLLVTGYAAYAGVYALLGLLERDGAVLFVVFAAYGTFLAATEGVERALVADLAPGDRHGTAFGWFNLVAGAMLLPASVAFGWIYETWSAPAAFAFSASCAGLAAVLMAFWVRPGRGQGSR